MRRPIAFAILLLVAGCAPRIDPHDMAVPINGEKDSRFKSALSRLAPNEQALVREYLASHPNRDAKALQPTVGDAIFEQIKEHERLARQQAPANPTLTLDFSQEVEGTLRNVQTIRSDVDRLSPGDQLVLTLELHNKGAKTIGVVAGNLSIENGEKLGLKGVDLTYKGSIPPGATVLWQAVSELGPGDERLLRTPVSELVSRFAPTSVQYAN